jgi:metal-dependent amidase/aminoacylase/carboxypeptidase family protein
MEIQGKGGHGALPEKCVDALRVAALTVPVLLSRPFGPITLSLGELQAGRAANVLPDTALLSGTVRSMKEGALVFALNEMEKSARGVASAFGARATLSVTSRCPRLWIDDALRQKGQRIFSALLGESAVHPMTAVAGASEDFAFVSEKCPSLTVALAAGRREDGYAFPLHHPRTVFDEAALPYGAALYAALAFGLKENDL